MPSTSLEEPIESRPTVLPFKISPRHYCVQIANSYLLDKLVKALPSDMSIAKLGVLDGKRYYLLVPNVQDMTMRAPELARKIRETFSYADFVSPGFLSDTGQIKIPSGITKVIWAAKPALEKITDKAQGSLRFIDRYRFELTKASTTYYPGFLPWLTYYDEIADVDPEFLDFNVDVLNLHRGKQDPYGV